MPGSIVCKLCDTGLHEAAAWRSRKALFDSCQRSVPTVLRVDGHRPCRRRIHGLPLIACTTSTRSTGKLRRGSPRCPSHPPGQGTARGIPDARDHANRVRGTVRHFTAADQRSPLRTSRGYAGYGASAQPSARDHAAVPDQSSQRLGTLARNTQPGRRGHREPKPLRRDHDRRLYSYSGARSGGKLPDPATHSLEPLACA